MPTAGEMGGEAVAGLGSSPGARLVRRTVAGLTLPRRVVLEAGIVLAGSLLLVLLLTWPLVLHLGTEIPGMGTGGDRSGYTWDIWFSSGHGLRLWGTTSQEVVSAPFGREMPASANVLQIVFLGPAWLISQVTGPMAALNVSLLLGMTLSPAAMYLLVRWLGLGIIAATWAAVAFALFPNALIRASAHYPMALLACFPILLLALWRWMERPDMRRGIWLAAATAFCWMTNPYYGTMAFVIVGTGGAMSAWEAGRASGLRDAWGRCRQVLAPMTVIVFVPLAALFLSARGAVQDTFGRSRAELEVYGARVTDYLLPDQAHGVFQAIFGRDRWVGLGAPGGERGDFVGYLTLALAIVAVVIAVRGWRTLSRRLRLVLATAGPLVGVLVWFSLATPTRWWGVTIPTPSGAIFDLAPFLRVYARFAVPVTAVLLVVAAVGLSRLVRRLHPAAAIAALVAAVGVSALELPPAGGVPLTSEPPLTLGGFLPEDIPAWAWLRDEAPRDALVYSFPAGANEMIERYHMHAQLVHGLRIVNGDPIGNGIGADVTTAITKPTAPMAAARLRALGVDYVLVMPSIYALAGITPPNPYAPPEGFRLTKVFSDGSAMWTLTARPLDAVPIFQRSSWLLPQRRGGTEVRYLTDSARVWVYARTAGTYRVAFDLRSTPETLERGLLIAGPDGWRRNVVAGAERRIELTVPLRQGRNDFTLTNEGAPATPVRPGDPRSVSMRVSMWSLSRA